MKRNCGIHGREERRLHEGEEAEMEASVGKGREAWRESSLACSSLPPLPGQALSPVSEEEMEFTSNIRRCRLDLAP